MTRLCASVVKIARDESGTETLEWGLVCGLIVFVATAAPPKTTAAVAAPAPAPMRKSRRVTVAFTRSPSDFDSDPVGVESPASPIGHPQNFQ